MKSQFASWILVLAAAAGLNAQDAVRLKTGVLGGARAGGRLTAGQHPPSAGHYILQFERVPDGAVRRELARRGVRVLEYVPDNALMAAVPEGFEGAGLGLVGWVHLDAADKVSPLAAAGSGYYVAVFQADADMADAQALAESYGFQVLPNASLLPQQLLIAGNSSQLPNLAAWDETSYIMPASTDLIDGLPVMSCAGAFTEAGPVGNYVLVSQGWAPDANGVVSLHYVFGALASQLQAAVVESEIERAFATWQKYANLSLTAGSQSDAVRTIYVEFVNGSHGDAYPFTSSAALAHTFYPNPPNSEPIAGDMHFNAAESWMVGSGMDVFSVALHETGHALGLGHSDLPTAVMYPYYHQASGLTDDDIAGIQALYGRPGPATTTPANPPAPNPPAPNPPAPNPPPSSAPPTLTLISPGSTMVATASAVLRFIGTAASSVGISSVKWSDSYGNSGVASGTTSWTADVALLVGTNMITIRVYDASGNSTWRSATVVRN